MDGTSRASGEFRFKQVIGEICDLGWSGLAEAEVVDAAWAYYFFSVQFQENLDVARALYPDDPKLVELASEESNTDNLSPWPDVAAEGEKMNHCEFMRRVLELVPIAEDKRYRFAAAGACYLERIRAMEPHVRALSIASYEDGGLERVFGAMMKSRPAANKVVEGFRYFLFTHIQFDSDPDGGHGALARHLAPDDRVLPLWSAFYDLLVGFVPALAVPEEPAQTRVA
ncbi:MAG TPA: hypothetical protein VHX19_09480 [Stellaceae bacterium]|nr:hypothetical protein [Stellaceae bacterium]